MEVLLRADVPKLGKRGEVVKVATGYARNYLLPQKLALSVTPANVQLLERERKKSELLETERVAKLEQLAASLGESSVTLTVRANEEGHLFGSVGAESIAEALKAKGFAIGPEMIDLAEHIKELGVYELTVKLDPKVSGKIKVWVVGE